ncbi:5325_t:CDS:1 [Cetraspora pellucida]|uniref:5325_t:CDS:1 n=1 Tax=Cetraspora pellucida TaxID=1433469 RepID=A0ACA9KNS1_9GLOM|nr:5325_t:CDS:1 [Cetraspora pellucida]
MNSNQVEITANNNESVQEKKYIIMNLKEEWELVETRLLARNRMTLIHLVASTFTVAFGTILYFLEEYDRTNNVLNIITSSIAATGGLLALIKSIGEKVNVSSLVQATKKVVDTGGAFIPMLIAISDDQLKALSTKRHKEYINFLKRINILVEREWNWAIWFGIGTSSYVIISAIIAILVNTGHLTKVASNIDRYLAVSIVVVGVVWLFYVLFLHIIKFINTASNVHWSSKGDFEGFCYNIYLAVLYIPMIIPTLPWVGYFFFMGRMYAIKWAEESEFDKVEFFGNEKERVKEMLNITNFFKPKHLSCIFQKAILKLKTDYKFIFEFIELTEDQRNELRRLMCGLEGKDDF